MSQWSQLTTTGSLALDDLQFHVLDLYSHEQEVDLANYNILQMVPDTNMITIITHTAVYFRWYLTPI